MIISKLIQPIRTDFIDGHNIQRMDEFLLPFIDKFLEKIPVVIFVIPEINVQIS